MPTEVVLNGVECRLNVETDPEVFVCNWRGNEVVSGDSFVLAGEETSDVPVGDTLDGLLTAADYTIE